MDAYAVSGVQNPIRVNIPLKQCNDSNIDPGLYIGDKESAFHVNSSCIKFDKETIIGGFPNTPDFKYVEIQVFPCIEDPSEDPRFDGKCKTKGFVRGNTIDNHDPMKLAFEKIRNFTLEMHFSQTGADLDIFDKPLVRTIDSNN